jgi:two-component system nitrogen regulation response regulator GlnG
VRQGAFSRDLYEVLGVIVLRLPPLRERKEDVGDLVQHFIDRANADLNRQLKGVDERVTRMLMDHSWPGNVAELEVVLKRACILARGDVLTPDDVRDALDDPTVPGRQEAENALRVAVRAALHQRLVEGDLGPGASPYYDVVSIVEETLAKEALGATGGNQVRAAEILGVNRTTLRKKAHGD